jgi:hypothetical protein
MINLWIWRIHNIFLYPPRGPFLSSIHNTSSSSISIGINILHLFLAWTLHSSINSYLCSHNENICEYRGFIIFSYTHQVVSFCLPWHFTHLLIFLYHPIMRKFVNIELSSVLSAINNVWWSGQFKSSFILQWVSWFDEYISSHYKST